jgi:hypothetical protein
MPHEDMEEDPLSTSQASPAAATAADAAASTALASMLRTSCTIIDMGSYLLSELCSRPYTADDAALPCIAGEHVRQILPEALVERAALFPPFDPARQVPLQAVACLFVCSSAFAACLPLMPRLSAHVTRCKLTAAGQMRAEDLQSGWLSYISVFVQSRSSLCMRPCIITADTLHMDTHARTVCIKT